MHGSPKTTTVASGFLLPECATWHDDALWFVDMLRGTINRFSDGLTETVMGFERPSAVGFRPDGTMIVADGTTRLVHVLNRGSVVESLDLSLLTPHLNDMTIDHRGRAYIDAFGTEGTAVGTWTPSGCIVLVDFETAPRIVANHLVAPNGIGISPDHRTLVVGEAMGQGEPLGARLVGYTIEDDGDLTDKRILGTIQRGLGDGLCVDSEGAVWVSTAFGHEVQRFLDGEVIDSVRLADCKWALSCALGGPDLKTLFICTTSAPPGGDPSLFSEGFIEAIGVRVAGLAR